MEDFELELKRDFLNESVDLLNDAEGAFLSLDKERTNTDLLNKIFRVAHNLKGTSKAVGFDQLAEVTHIAENLILKLKEGTLPVTDSAVTVLLKFKDKINEMIEGLKEEINQKFDTEEIKQDLNAVINGKVEVLEKKEELPLEASAPERPEKEDKENKQEESFNEISVAAITSLFENGQSLETIIKMLEDSNYNREQIEAKLIEAGLTPVELFSVKAVQIPVPEIKTTPKAPSPPAATSSAVKQEEDSIRVKLSAIDKLNNFVGELVILQTMLGQRRFTHIQDELSIKSIGQMSKLFKEVQELAMSLRMIPLKQTFQKMSRIVRDTSKALEKEVSLHLKGEETEVDKTVLEGLSDPLVHIVRNAVDHGLENKEDRIKAQKSEVGNVEILAYHEGSNLVIQVTDDGKGLDPQKLKNKAIEKGLIPANSDMSDKDAIDLIFHPGFSTKEKVTEVSGRGVGMDVVKTNITKLGGKVRVMSKIGQGSSFKIILPLTLAIIDGMAIKCAEQLFVLPLSQVFEIVLLKRKDIESFTGGGELFKLRGEVIPLFDLNSKIGLPAKKIENNIVIVVRGLRYAFGVRIDDVINQQQIVVKKLGKDIRGQAGLIGSAIMGNGRPAVILDLFELYKDDLKESRAFKNQKINAA